jgi:hypothetical protein
LPGITNRQAIPDIEGDHDPCRPVGRHELSGETRPAQGSRPDDDPGSAGRQRRRDRFRVPEAPGHLAGDALPHRRHDPADQLALAAPAAARPIEIDHMQPRSPGRSKIASDSDRVVSEGRLRREIAPTQADDAPVAEVDRREQLETRRPGTD